MVIALIDEKQKYNITLPATSLQLCELSPHLPSPEILFQLIPPLLNMVLLIEDPLPVFVRNPLQLVPLSCHSVCNTLFPILQLNQATLMQLVQMPSLRTNLPVPPAARQHTGNGSSIGMHMLILHTVNRCHFFTPKNRGEKNTMLKIPRCGRESVELGITKVLNRL